MVNLFITNECTACAECLEVCEDEAIDEVGDIYRINASCTDCGACEPICPVGCIVRSPDGRPPQSGGGIE